MKLILTRGYIAQTIDEWGEANFRHEWKRDKSVCTLGSRLCRG